MCVCGRGVCVWQGVCDRGHMWQGGMHGEEACVAGGCACQGGVCGRGACLAGGDMRGRGACMVGEGGVHGTYVPPPIGRYYEIRSMSRRYASYWNAFLFLIN